MMGSSSPYLKLLIRHMNMNRGFNFKDHHFKSPPPFLHHKSISLSTLPLSISSFQDNHDLFIQQSPNGYTSNCFLFLLIIIIIISTSTQERCHANVLDVEAETQTVGVRFQLQRECSFGHHFLITGDHPILGLWDPNNAISLTWSDGHIWTVELDIPVGKCIKFKFIMQETNGNFLWQPGPDRILQTQKIITLCEDWDNPDSRIILENDNPTTISELQPQGYIKEVLVSDEGVPLLVPGLTQLTVLDNDEPDDMAKDLTLPELYSKGNINTSNSNPRPEISSIHENQESCENKHQEMKVAEEQDLEAATQPITSLLHNDIQWSNNVMQKFLNLFGIQ